MNKYIKALVKVTSQYEYAQNFRDGKLWMNELRFFTKCEQKELGDAKEARGTTFSFLNHTYHLINNQDLCRPIFCLYGVYDTKHGNTSFISIPEKMKAFGTYAVVVTDVEEFLNRLRRVPLIFSPIDYQELDLHDPNSKTPFRPYFHTRFGLCGVRRNQNALAVEITGSNRMTDGDGVLVKVDGIPFQTDCFAPA